MDNHEFARIREDLGITQNLLARVLCISLKTVQSFEQGWRDIPSHIEREMLLLQVIKHTGSDDSQTKPCWEITDCDNSWRNNCLVWKLKARQFCWYLNGTFCRGKSQDDWQEKIKLCKQCEVFQGSISCNPGGPVDP